MIKNVISVIDGAAGSCGKAKVIGEIATDKSINLGAAVTNCMPNAGHTFVDEDGYCTVFRNIPVSSVNPNTELFIGPGSAIDMEVFMAEYERVKPYLNGRKIYVHEMVPLIEERHKNWERRHIRSGSTFKGCGAVTQEKVVRDAKLQFFKDFKDAIVCSNDEWLDRLHAHLDNPYEYTILEGAQGCDLSLNHSGNYPYVTSRNVSTAQLLADSGISPERLLQTIMVIRPFPIRISNSTELGKTINSGGYGSARELTWSEVNFASAYGWYPSQGLVRDFKKDYSLNTVKKFYKSCPRTYYEQIFGPNYKTIKLEDITIEQALELERLTYKSQGEYMYESEFVDMPVLKWSMVEGGACMIDQSEETTVTKRERRIFDLDIDKLKNNCRINTPSSLYLNFFQHIEYDCEGLSCNFEEYDIGRAAEEYINWLEWKTDLDISVLGTGPRNGDRILRYKLIKDIERR